MYASKLMNLLPTSLDVYTMPKKEMKIIDLIVF